MTLGKKLKSLRIKHNFSQPELADKMCIEQSYLSKLENDKSVPSNDIFNNILLAFDLTVEQFLTDIPFGSELEKLKKIPDVAQYLTGKQKHSQNTQRQFLYISSMLIVLAVSVFYSGFSQLIFPETQFQYESDGVLKEGEPDNVFYRWEKYLTQEQKANVKYRENRRLEMLNRIDEKSLTRFDYAGSNFSLKVEGGSRYYRFEREKEVKRPMNAWLQVLGVFLFSAGVMGFVLERRLYRTAAQAA